MSQNLSEVQRREFIAQEEKKLAEEQQRVRDELANLRLALQSEVDIEPDEGDAEVFEREKNQVLIGVLEKRLSDITAALRSVEKGTYGVCQRCSKQIEVERLEVKPDATHCLNCQREMERLNKRNRPSRQIDW